MFSSLRCHPKSLRRRFLGTLVVLLLIGSPSALAKQKKSKMVADSVSTGINMLVQTSDAGFVGVITEIGPVRWNTTSGKRWTSAPKGTPMFPLRPASVRIERSLFGPVSKGEVITVFLWGSGNPNSTNEGPEITDAAMGKRYPASMSTGTLAVGDSIIGLVRTFSPVAVDPNGGAPVVIGKGWGFNGAYQGVWTAVGTDAVSFNPKRSAPFDELVNRIIEERAAGRVIERDAGTSVNPLGKAAVAAPPQLPSGGPIPTLLPPPAVATPIRYPGPADMRKVTMLNGVQILAGETENVFELRIVTADQNLLASVTSSGGKYIGNSAQAPILSTVCLASGPDLIVAMIADAQFVPLVSDGSKVIAQTPIATKNPSQATYLLRRQPRELRSKR